MHDLPTSVIFIVIVMYIKRSLLKMIVYNFKGGKFYVHDERAQSCPDGTSVLDEAECKAACGLLNIRLSNTFRDGKPCYKGGNNVCKQTGVYGSKASMICKQLGKLRFFAFMPNRCELL